MAAPQTTGVTTRQMHRRREIILANGGKDATALWGNNAEVSIGRKSRGKLQSSRSCDKEDFVDDSGLDLFSRDSIDGSVSVDHSCRTFPLQHGEQSQMADSMGKRQPKTETSSKQVRQ
ncbi:hypothetical protein ElyMa_001697500 [Elysia marginata]|uniref:Uncharacterized protein n=1 Tax=Elysia marginata TaxID=1093978 RepID=A0AAV4JSS8_9GAST|nr:hypothetical protein ElyMa_001697500 [Elysia marginata]